MTTLSIAIQEVGCVGGRKVDNLDDESTVVAENNDRSYIHRDLFRIPRGQTSSLQVRVQELEDVNVHQHPLIRRFTNLGVQNYGSVENEPSPHLNCGAPTERIVA